LRPLVVPAAEDEVVVMPDVVALAAEPDPRESERARISPTRSAAPIRAPRITGRFRKLFMATTIAVAVYSPRKAR
jgi:hypothetical protein